MKMGRHFGAAMWVAATALCYAEAVSAQAPDAAAVDSSEDRSGAEIIVTARKRSESLIATPVVVTALGAAELERRAVNTLDAITRLVPGVVIGEGGGAVQGGEVYIRGIGGADTSVFADGAVSFNIDGVAISRGFVRRMAQMDMQQVEILEGPQALYYGKNSPAGIVSIRTKDPTPSFKAGGSAGYEFVGHEVRGEGYVSGPIAPNLGFRISAYGSNLRGWLKNTAPDGLLTTPDKRRAPNADEFAVRGTLKLDLNEGSYIRGKLTYGSLKGLSPQAANDLIFCPLGTPQSGAIDDCKPGRTVINGDLGPNFARISPRFGDGHNYQKVHQLLTSVEGSFNLNEDINLTMVTGLYDLSNRAVQNNRITYIPAAILPSAIGADIKDWSQEIRITSDFSGPLNMMVGAHYSGSKLSNYAISALNAVSPTFVSSSALTQKGEAWSIFGQIMYDITPTLELSAGARYSHEKKRLTRVAIGSAMNAEPTIEIAPNPRRQSWSDVSPEATLTYRPNSDLTVFGSYKEGFLSGGFNGGSAAFVNGVDLRYNQETIKGFEAGIKALMMDRKLRLTLAAYSYKLSGLQVGVSVKPDNSANVVTVLTNAGEVRTKGASANLSFSPDRAWNLHGAIAYNKGRYVTYFAPCYRGQNQPDCRDRLNPFTGTVGPLQDLSGTPLVRAPEISGNVGLSYESSVTSSLDVGFNIDVAYSDAYVTDGSSTPFAESPSYTLLDGGVRVMSADRRWEVALIGKNLTNERYWVRTNGIGGTGTPAGAAAGSRSLLPDVTTVTSRGREVMLRISFNLG